jgi:surfeit locus 1 family protein
VSAATSSFGSARPSLWATLFTVPAVLAMLGLGTWQMERLHWKEEMIQRMHARVGSSPVPLPAVVANPDDLDLRPVTVTGRLLNDRAMLMLARPRQGQVGYEVVTPLQRVDGGAQVLVNRGWIPMDKREARRDGPAGEVTLRGVARVPGAQGWMQPDNRPGAEVWNRIDLPAMAAAAGLPAVAPVVVEALPGQSPAGQPAGIEPRAELPNNHLQYAITWYSLAATLLVIYVVFHLRRRTDS